MSYEKDLEQYDEEWPDLTITEPRSFDDVPPGRYQVEVEGARVETSESSGRLQFTMFFRVISGGLEDASIPKYTGLDTEQGREIVKNDLHRMGMELDRLSELPPMTPMLIGLKLEVTVKLKEKDGKTYRNIFINKLISEQADNPSSDGPF